MIRYLKYDTFSYFLEKNEKKNIQGDKLTDIFQNKL